jgi:hypothetical protein
MTWTRRGLLAAVGGGATASLAGCVGRGSVAGGEATDGAGLSLVAVRAPRFAQQGEPFSVEFVVRNGGDRPAKLRTALEFKEDRSWEVLDEVETAVEPDGTARVSRSDQFFHFVSREYRLAEFDKSVTVKTMCNCTHI